MSRRGTGLVELTIAIGLTMTLFAVVMTLTSHSARTIAGIERHLDAMHAAQMTLERIEDDLHRLVLRAQDEPSLFAGVGLTATSRDAIAFAVAHPGPSGRQAVYVGLPVAYRAVPAGGLFSLSRNGAPLGPAVFRRVEFRLERAPGLVAGRTIALVRTLVVGVDPTAGTEFTLEALTALDPLTHWPRHAAHNPNPDAQAPVLAFAK